MTRGGKKKVQVTRGGSNPRKRLRNMVIEPNSGPAPKYKQARLPLSSDVPSATGTVASSSAASGRSTPTVSTQSRIRHPAQPARRVLIDEATDSEGEDVDIGAQPAQTAQPAQPAQPAQSAQPAQPDQATLDAGASSAQVRGCDRPISPVAHGEEKKKCEVSDGKLQGDGVSRFFRNIIKNNIDDLWEYYEKIPREKREAIWIDFLDHYYIVGAPESVARGLFIADSKVKWRTFLCNMRSLALQVNKVEDVAELLGKPVPTWLASEAVWEKYVRHWMSPRQRAISIQASKNRRSSAGRRDDKIAVHPFGSKGLLTRVYEQKQKTGVAPNPLKIRIDMNTKKDKVTNLPTGEYYDDHVQDAYVEYEPLFKGTHGDGLDPLECQWDKGLWTSTEKVKPGMGKGRVLGVGTSAAAAHVMSVIPAPALSNEVVDELRRKCAEVDELKKKCAELDELKRQREEDAATNKSLKEEMESMKSTMTHLSGMVMSLFSGRDGEGTSTGLTSFASLPSVESTATGLLARMSSFPPPQQQVPNQQAPQQQVPDQQAPQQQVPDHQDPQQQVHDQHDPQQQVPEHTSLS